MLTGTTELDAVNTLLGSIGEAPVNAVVYDGLSDAAVALRVLLRIARKIESQGPRCCVEEDFPLTPDAVTGEINIPSNILNVKGRDPYREIVLRGTKLYDKTNHTYRFDRTIQCDVTWFLPFNNLPEHVKHLIVIRATHQFQKEVMASNQLATFTEEDLREAQAEFVSREMTNNQITMLTSPGVAPILDRRF